jgi:hypothetical protein
MDIKKELIVAYKELFFNTSRIRGQLGKTAYYEGIFRETRESSEQHKFAKMLRDAHLGGPEVVMAQFNITIDDYSIVGYKDRAQKLMVWREKVVDRDDRDYQALQIETKLRDAMISTVTKAAAKEGTNKVSDVAALAKAVQEMNKEGLGRATVSPRLYDVTDETVYDTEEDKIKKIPSKQEEK